MMIQFEFSSGKNTLVKGEVGQSRILMSTNGKKYFQSRDLLRQGILKKGNNWIISERYCRRKYEFLHQYI